MLAFFLMIFLVSKRVIVVHAESFSDHTFLSDFSTSEVSHFPSFSRTDLSSRDSYSQSTNFDSVSCLTNISLTVKSFTAADATKLGDALCSLVGSDLCTSIAFVSQSQEVVTVYEGSSTPGVSTPVAVQKISLSYSYSMEAQNRTYGISRLLNGVRYTSSLSSFGIQQLVVGGETTIYERPADPILSYIGNTTQCLSSYWYLIFFIVMAPILGASYHYYYWVTKDNQEMLTAAYPTPVTGRTMNSNFNSVPVERGLYPPPTQQTMGNLGNGVQPTVEHWGQ